MKGLSITGDLHPIYRHVLQSALDWTKLSGPPSMFSVAKTDSAVYVTGDDQLVEFVKNELEHSLRLYRQARADWPGGGPGPKSMETHGP